VGSGSLASGTISRQSGGYHPEQSAFLRINNTTTGTQAGSSYAVLLQNIEDVRTFAGKTVTLSIWASSTIPNKEIRFYADQYFGSGGSSVVSTIPSYPAPGAHTLTSSIARYDVTFNIPSISGKIIGPSSYLQVGIVPAYGPTNSANKFGLPQLDWQGIGNIDIYGVQINEGPPADFETAGRGYISNELILCQRYFEKSYPLSTQVGVAASTGEVSLDTNAIVNSGSSHRKDHSFFVTKRATPIVTLYPGGGITPTANTIYVSAANRAAVASNITDRGFFLIQNNSGVSWAAGSTLAYFWTADAEI